MALELEVKAEIGGAQEKTVHEMEVEVEKGGVPGVEGAPVLNLEMEQVHLKFVHDLVLVLEVAVVWIS